MSGVPPGYNPSDSVLQGGTNAQIVPVMGGGGSGTAPENQSLLSGGNDAVIHPVSGGARGAMKKRSQRVAASSARASPRSAASPPPVSALPPRPPSGPPAVDAPTQPTVDAPTQPPEAAPTQPTVDDNMEFEQLIANPTGDSEANPKPATKLKKSPMFDITGPTTQPLPATRISPRSLPSQISKSLKNAYITRQKTLWNRLTGGAAAQYLTLATCPDNQKLQKDNDLNADEIGYDRLVVFIPTTTRRIVVLPPVRGDTAVFVKCLEAIQPLTNSKNTVCIFSAPFLGYDPAANKGIFAKFLEMKTTPQFAGRIFAVPDHRFSNYVAGCTIDPAYENGEENSSPLLNMLEPTYLILYSPDADFQGKSGILFSGGAVIGLPMGKPGTTSVSEILATPDERPPPSLAISPADPLQEDTAATTQLSLFKVRGVSETMSIFTIKPIGEKYSQTILSALPDNFIEATDLKDLPDTIATVPLTVGNGYYRIRDPGAPGVYDDWLQQRFTPDEATLLNDMHLRPSLVAGLFKDEIDPYDGSKKAWQETLADFLRNIIDSKCFTDSTLLTKRECEQGRNFLNRIYEYILLNTASILEMSELDQEQLNDQLTDAADTAQALLRIAELKAARAAEQARSAAVAVQKKDDIEKSSRSAVRDGKIEKPNDNNLNATGGIYDLNIYYPDPIKYTEDSTLGTFTPNARIRIQYDDAGNKLDIDAVIETLKKEYQNEDFEKMPSQGI